MRTTLDIDDDVLQAAKELAAARRSTAGKVLSALARQALRPEGGRRIRNGVPVLPPRPGARPVTSEGVRHLLDDEQQHRPPPTFAVGNLRQDPLRSLRAD